MTFIKLKNALIFFTLVFSLLFFSCTKKTESEDFSQLTEELNTTSNNISWYYFTKDSFFKTDTLENIPGNIFVPWQDAVRITDSFQTETEACMLVNKSGLLLLGSGETELITDATIFKNTSAGSFLQCGQFPLFNIYKNNFFTTDNSNQTDSL